MRQSFSKERPPTLVIHHIEPYPDCFDDNSWELTNLGSCRIFRPARGRLAIAVSQVEVDDLKVVLELGPVTFTGVSDVTLCGEIHGFDDSAADKSRHTWRFSAKIMYAL